MSKIEKINKALLNTSNNISCFNQNKNDFEKYNFIYDCLLDFASLLKYILIEYSSDDYINYNEIIKKIEFETSRLFEITGISQEDFKNKTIIGRE